MRCDQCGKSNGTVQETGFAIQAERQSKRSCSRSTKPRSCSNSRQLGFHRRRHASARAQIPAHISRGQAIKGLKASMSVAEFTQRTPHEERYRPASGNLRFRAPNARSAEG